MTIEDLIRKVMEYNPEEVEVIRKAYEYADRLHSGQVRQSGEPYISHPLNVAYILAEMHADRDTVCAGLLHDTLEDTNTTKQDIAEIFNEDIANLVDGVTKISKLNFSSKQEANLANTRKIITGITEDVRIIIIKLADRLHNMRTLQYKSEYKQKENSMETMDLFVPLAYYIGAYQIKSELEDLSLQYIYPEEYKRIEEQRLIAESEYIHHLVEMQTKIKEKLLAEGIQNDMQVRTKNKYGIYKKFKTGHKLDDIHDLFAIKIMVDSVSNCYNALRIVHHSYRPIDSKFKDYICNAKTNMYRSLHTTVFGPGERSVHNQIRTYDMDKIATHGITSYWDVEKGNARQVMQQDLKEKYQFFQSLVEINAMFGDNQDFVNQVRRELLSQNIYVYTTEGKTIALPVGATPIDFAYEVDPRQAITLVYAKVNDEYVSIDYSLQNKDIVQLITDPLAYGPKPEWEEKATTAKAKRLIREFNNSIKRK